MARSKMKAAVPQVETDEGIIEKVNELLTAIETKKENDLRTKGAVSGVDNVLETSLRRWLTFSAGRGEIPKTERYVPKGIEDEKKAPAIEPVDLTKFNVEQLRAIAKQEKIKGFEEMSQEELIKAISEKRK